MTSLKIDTQQQLDSILSNPEAASHNDKSEDRHVATTRLNFKPRRVIKVNNAAQLPQPSRSVSYFHKKPSWSEASLLKARVDALFATPAS